MSEPLSGQERENLLNREISKDLAEKYAKEVLIGRIFAIDIRATFTSVNIGEKLRENFPETQKTDPLAARCSSAEEYTLALTMQKIEESFKGKTTVPVRELLASANKYINESIAAAKQDSNLGFMISENDPNKEWLVPLDSDARFLKENTSIAVAVSDPNPAANNPPIPNNASNQHAQNKQPAPNHESNVTPDRGPGFIERRQTAEGDIIDYYTATLDGNPTTIRQWNPGSTDPLRPMKWTLANGEEITGEYTMQQSTSGWSVTRNQQLEVVETLNTKAFDISKIEGVIEKLPPLLALLQDANEETMDEVVSMLSGIGVPEEQIAKIRKSFKEKPETKKMALSIIKGIASFLEWAFGWAGDLYAGIKQVRDMDLSTLGLGGGDGKAGALFASFQGAMDKILEHPIAKAFSSFRSKGSDPNYTAQYDAEEKAIICKNKDGVEVGRYSFPDGVTVDENGKIRTKNGGSFVLQASKQSDGQVLSNNIVVEDKTDVALLALVIDASYSSNNKHSYSPMDGIGAMSIARFLEETGVKVAELNHEQLKGCDFIISKDGKPTIATARS